MGTLERKIKRKKEAKINLNEYTKLVMEKRQTEKKNEDILNDFGMEKGEGLSSPTTSTSTEETRLLMDYIDKSNLFNISKVDEKRGKVLKLRKFFKSKRNQQVEIYAKYGTKKLYKEGKVSAVGRDFVMLTSLKERIWIPYSIILSANIPYGVPNYSNTHQHILFDNNLRKKLLYQFGETVMNRDELKQIFFEESLQTNLDSWSETWVIIHLNEQSRKIGKIISSNDNRLLISKFRKKESFLLSDVKYIESIRFITLFSHFIKRLSN